MNIFFHTSGRSAAAKDYLEQLRGLSILNRMMIFPAGPLFRSSLALKMRSGDLLLLFMGNGKKADELLALKNDLFNFRVILILEESVDLRRAYALQPCFIAFQNEDITRVEAVIKKVTESNAAVVRI